MKKTDFLKHAHMEFITRLGPKKKFNFFFGNFFFLALHPPAVPPGDYTPL